MTRGRPNPLHSRLPERLRQVRRATETARRSLSVTVGYSKAAVQGIEHDGHIPRVDLVEALARVLGVSPGWLAYGQGDPDGVQDVPGCATLGERLRATREAQGIAVRELARRCGSDPTHSTIHNIEGGRLPTVARVEVLADALDVSPAWLAYGEGPQKVKRRRARS